MDYQALRAQVLAFLHQEHRVAYRILKRQFQLDDETLDDLKDDLIYAKKLAVDEDGRVLVWTGGAAQPPQAEAIPAPSSRPDAERRQLTVLFCDLVDSTVLASQLDPEDLRAVVRAYQEAAATVIEHYAGHIAQYLGDGLLVYFGYPTAHEDDARRAVHTGLGIVEAIAALNTRLATHDGVQLAVRLGIHTGPVVVGVMGGGGRHEHLALGETPNVAARLQNLAPANTVVISAVTARLVHGTFAVEDMGPHTLHGVTEPMTVSRVRGVLAPSSHDEDFVAAAVPVLVGREEESGLLRRRWEQSKTGVGQVVLLSGEAGIGKSALVEGLRAQVRAEGLPRIAYRCSPYHTTSALYPVITQIEHLLQFAPDDPPTNRLAKLEAGLRPYGLPLAEVVPLLAGLLSIPLPAERYAPLMVTPQKQKQQTLDALVAWLVAEAERQPVLVVWEDLHWADPTTLEVLGLVITQAPTVPMLHVLTFRPEFSPPWPQRSHITPLMLNRLERPQVETLITQRAGGTILPPEVVQYIVAKTDGVPLYVEELTAMLLASPLLQAEADQYVLTGSLHTVAIPETLQDALMARLDQLTTAKEVAQLGAVLGREFAYELLQAIAPQDENTLQAGLAQLADAELLYQRGRPPRAKYMFKHALLQDAAYASLLKSTRQQVHQQIAEVLEVRFPGLVETQPELVAQHYTAAGCPEQAVRYWQRAGQRALERSAYVEATSHLTTGLDVLTRLTETRGRHRHELSLQLTLAQALHASKGQSAPEVERAYARAQELCGQVDDTPQLFRALLGLYRFYGGRLQLQLSRELTEQLSHLAQRAQEPDLLLEAYMAQGTIALLLGELGTARRHLEQAIACYDRQHHRAHAFIDPGVISGSRLSWVLWLLGYPEQALRKSQDTLTLAQTLPHPYSLVNALHFAAMFHQFRREVLATSQLAEATVTLAAEQGMARWLAVGTFLRGWALTVQGQGDDGLVQMRQSLTHYRATGTLLDLPWYLGVLAETCGSTDRVDEGCDAIADALAVADNTGYYAAELYRLKGELLLAQAGHGQQWLEAETCFQQALAIARGQQAKSWELRATMSLSRLWHQQGKRAEAYELLAPIYGWFTEGFDTIDLQEAKTLLEDLV